MIMLLFGVCTCSLAALKRVLLARLRGYASVGFCRLLLQLLRTTAYIPAPWLCLLLLLLSLLLLSMHFEAASCGSLPLAWHMVGDLVSLRACAHTQRRKLLPSLDDTAACNAVAT